MSGADIVLVTGAELPAPDVESPLLVAALAEHGLEAEIHAWDEGYAWEQARLVVCRTPWDYFGRAAEFLDWADGVAARTRLENPAPLVRWNAHKSYLRELAAAGVPVVPTTVLPRGASVPEQAAALAGGGEFVVKPAIGGGGLGARQGNGADPALHAHLAGLLAAGDALVQPFMASVFEGEVSLIFLGGELSHAVRKIPTDGDYRVQEHFGGRVVAHAPTPAERAAAQATLAAAPSAPAYARIDLVAGVAEPLLMELELIEPLLFLTQANGATERFAAVLAACAARDRSSATAR